MHDGRDALTVTVQMPLEQPLRGTGDIMKIGLSFQSHGKENLQGKVVDMSIIINQVVKV